MFFLAFSKGFPQNGFETWPLFLSNSLDLKKKDSWRLDALHRPTGPARWIEIARSIRSVDTRGDLRRKNERCLFREVGLKETAVE